MKLIKIGLTIAFAAGLTVCVYAEPAQAQFKGHSKIRKTHMEKSTWHKAPRQFQIIDDRPIIKDFREAPSSPEHISLPPPPRGFHGAHRGGGHGAMGEGPAMGGSNPMRLQGAPGDLPYRTGNGGRQLPLPKSGFGRHTNIPARGMAPKHALPSGHTTNRLMGKMNAPKKMISRRAINPGALKSGSRGARSRRSAPKVSSYGKNYGSGSGSGYGGANSSTKTFVRGSLLKKSGK